MLFSLIAVFGSWCFGDRRDDDIPTERPLRSHIRLYSHMVLARRAWGRGPGR